jgi:hypothetical protein
LFNGKEKSGRILDSGGFYCGRGGRDKKEGQEEGKGQEVEKEGKGQEREKEGKGQEGEKEGRARERKVKKKRETKKERKNGTGRHAHKRRR